MIGTTSMYEDLIASRVQRWLMEKYDLRPSESADIWKRTLELIDQLV